MDRQIVYPGAVPLDSDLLTAQRFAMVALGHLAQATLGSAVVADGLACSATTPASNSVTVGPGTITSLQQIDSTAFGSLPPDTSPIVKVGCLDQTLTFSLTPPPTAGQSTNYVIEAQFLEQDNTPVVLPYFNAANPNVPYSGPANTGDPQNTVRQQTVQLQLKAGAPATTGAQQTPSVDAGWVGLYIVTISNSGTVQGGAPYTSGDIKLYPGAPFISAKLPDLQGLTGGPWAPINSPALTGSPTAPTPTSADSSTRLATTAYVTQAVAAILAASGLTGGPYAPINSPSFTGAPLGPTPAASDSSTRLATTAFVQSNFYANLASAGLTGGPYAPINSPSFTGVPVGPTPGAGDNSARLATTAFVSAAVVASNQNHGMGVWYQAGTYHYTILSNVYVVRLRCVGGGGGGSNCYASANFPNAVANNSGGGGGAGGYAETLVSVAPGGSLTVTVGAGGGAEQNGGTSSVSYTAPGGGTTVVLQASGGYGSGFSQVAVSAGAAGGVGQAGTVQISGGIGSDGQGGLICSAGNGGASYFGGGGRAGRLGGYSSPNFGGGGGGAYEDTTSNTTRYGGNGGTGLVLLNF